MICFLLGDSAGDRLTDWACGLPRDGVVQRITVRAGPGHLSGLKRFPQYIGFVWRFGRAGRLTAQNRRFPARAEERARVPGRGRGASGGGPAGFGDVGLWCCRAGLREVVGAWAVFSSERLTHSELFCRARHARAEKPGACCDLRSSCERKRARAVHEHVQWHVLHG